MDTDTRHLTLECELCGYEVTSDEWSEVRHINRAWEDYDRVCRECANCYLYTRWDDPKNSEMYFKPQQEGVRVGPPPRHAVGPVWLFPTSNSLDSDVRSLIREFIRQNMPTNT